MHIFWASQMLCKAKSMIESMGVDSEVKATLLKILAMVLEDLWAETQEPTQYRSINLRVRMDITASQAFSSDSR